mmetsp:Transcript_101041/g.290804  ORF Transcript_101041/g.290804 Transcript_101041/m.290804 type:complete len:212 (-) Transcript_101041:721-1356(-)
MSDRFRFQAHFGGRLRQGCRVHDSIGGIIRRRNGGCSGSGSIGVGGGNFARTRSIDEFIRIESADGSGALITGEVAAAPSHRPAAAHAVTVAFGLGDGRCVDDDRAAKLRRCRCRRSCCPNRPPLERRGFCGSGSPCLCAPASARARGRSALGGERTCCAGCRGGDCRRGGGLVVVRAATHLVRRLLRASGSWTWDRRCHPCSLPAVAGEC